VLLQIADRGLPPRGIIAPLCRCAPLLLIAPRGLLGVMWTVLHASFDERRTAGREAGPSHPTAVMITITSFQMPQRPLRQRMSTLSAYRAASGPLHWRIVQRQCVGAFMRT